MCIFWNRGKALLNQHIFKVAFDKVNVNKDYFVFAVKHKLDEMVSKTHGATMKHIIKKDFDNTKIPFPSLEMQEETASILKMVSDIIDTRQQEIKNWMNLSELDLSSCLKMVIIRLKSWVQYVQRLQMEPIKRLHTLMKESLLFPLRTL